MRPRTRRLLTALCTLVVALPLVGVGCVDQFVLHPTTNSTDAGPATRETIAGPLGVVEAWVARSFPDANPADAFVLCFTGNEQRAERLAAYNATRWSPHRVEAWTVNFPGYGGSTGPARLRSIPPQALAAYDALAVRAGGKPIYVTSNSLGGTAALYVAANRPVAGVILQNPPALKQVIRNQGWWNLWLLAWPASLQVPDELDGPANARRVKVPAIFITAESDDVVMPKFQRLTIDAYAGPKRLLHLKHKGHDDTIDSPEEWAAFRELVDWLLER